MSAIIGLIARTLEPHRGLAWHGGPTPARALRGVSPGLARWRPPRGGHTIWELALHIAYWDYMVRKRLLGVAIPRFPRGPANWPAMPKRPDAATWAADCELVAEQHRLLLAVVEDFPVSRLGRRMGRSKRWSYGDTILGITVHDAYHSGQIQLLKRIGKRS